MYNRFEPRFVYYNHGGVFNPHHRDHGSAPPPSTNFRLLEDLDERLLEDGSLLLLG